jgi:hypothetical protein
MRRSNTHGIAVCNGDYKCHAYGNSYWYSFTYTNSKAVAHAQISAYTEAASNTCASAVIAGVNGTV